MNRLTAILLLLRACTYAATPRALSNVQPGYQAMALPQPKTITLSVAQPVYQDGCVIGVVEATSPLGPWQIIGQTALLPNAVSYQITATMDAPMKFWRSFTNYQTN